jgi:hypothetical protein
LIHALHSIHQTTSYLSRRNSYLDFTCNGIDLVIVEDRGNIVNG